MNDIYFSTQASALKHAEDDAKARGYIIDQPTHIWTEHVAYGQTVRYTLPLIVERTGGHARKHLHITLYRMDSGNYELTHYLA